MEEKNKKVLIPTIIAVVTLVLLTIGATYAYFKVATDNNFGTPKIEATTPSIGSVALSTGSNLTMNLTAEEMMGQSGPIDWSNNFEGEENNYINVNYYASSTGTKVAATTEKVGTATVTGDGVYNCTYTLTVDDNANSLYDKFQSGYANKSTGQVVLTVNGEAYDFNTTNLFPLTIDGTMQNLSSNDPQYITAQLKLLNSNYKDQSNLSGQNITLTFGVEDFSCTALEETTEGTKATDYILANASEEELWDSTLEGDGYRYIGTNPNNYVCFGYNDEETDCDFTNAENANKYAYRVIGIFEDDNGVEHVKLIKKESVGSYDYSCHDESSYWDETYNYLKDMPFKEDNNWINKITTWNYNLTSSAGLAEGNLLFSPDKIQETYLYEMNRSSNIYKTGKWGNIYSKFGLMYVSDYFLSLGSIEKNQDFNTSWIEFMNNEGFEIENTEDFHVEDYEWFMSAAGYTETCVDEHTRYGIYYYADTDFENISGEFTDYIVCSMSGYIVRPVFYLKHNTTMSGDGTIESPFIVNK